VNSTLTGATTKLVCKLAGEDPAHRKRKATRPGPYCLQCKRGVRQAATAARHEAYVLATYGLEAGEYAALKAAQGGVCFICTRATGAVRRLAVDHDHQLERDGLPMRDTVRGLLCKSCNKMLGFMRDDPLAFERAAGYLRNPPARSVLGIEKN
jgi:hypothetical protein